MAGRHELLATGPLTRVFHRRPSSDSLVSLLGRHQVHDPRSREYAVPEPEHWPDATARSPIVHQWYGPLFDQGRLGCCTSTAALGCLMTAPLWRSGRAFTALDIRELYHEETLLNADLGIPGGPWPPADNGSCFLASAKVLKQRGLIAGYRHAFGIKAALGALLTEPLSIGIGWYDSMLTPASNGLVCISQDAQVVGGHQIAVTALYPAEQVVGFANSWGPDWGVRGWGFMRWDTLDRLLAEGGDVGVLTL